MVRDEYVVYMAHWDHLGEDSSLEDDAIYNGAVDNATGTAGLLEIAAAFAQLETPPRRSLLFLAVTAEEQGLLGSRYYTENPVYPLEKTLAALNMDAMNIWVRQMMSRWSAWAIPPWRMCWRRLPGMQEGRSALILNRKRGISIVLTTSVLPNRVFLPSTASLA